MKLEMTTLGASCQFFNGKAHEKDIDAEGKYVVVNSKFISRDGKVRKYTGKQMFPLFEDDIVMVMSDVPNGKALAKCYIIEENDTYSLNQRICAIRSTEFNIRFLYYQLNRNPFFLAFNNGENQSNLRKGDILNCPLWKPSFEVQEQIVELLDEAFEQIDQVKDNIEKNIKNTKDLFQSKLNEIFNQNNDDWVSTTLGDVCSVLNGYAFKSKDTIDSSSTQLLRMGNLYQNILDLNRKPVFYPNSFAKLHKDYLLKEGDLIMSLTGTVDKTDYGYTVKIPKTEVDLLLNQRIMKIDVKDNSRLNKDYLRNYLLSPDFLKRLYETSSGTRQANLSSKTILTLYINFPVEIDQQEKIVRQFEDLKDTSNYLENFYLQKLTLIENLKLSILQKAFSGELAQNILAI